MAGYVADAANCGEFELARPWKRFWARTFDTILYALPIGLVLGLIFPWLFQASWFQSRGGSLMLGVIVLPFALMIDAVVLSMFGTSAGKAIAGLRVHTLDREKLGLEAAFKRNLALYLKGFFLGIPLLILLGYINGYTEVKEAGFSSWDDDTASRVFDDDPSEWRLMLIAVLGIAAIVLDRALALYSAQG